MDELIEYIDYNVNLMEKEEKKLIATDRKDESNLVRIRKNIFALAKSIYEETRDNKKTDDYMTAYLSKIEKMKESWIASMKLAEKHNDIERKVIEELKLQTIQEVQKEILHIQKHNQKIKVTQEV